MLLQTPVRTRRKCSNTLKISLKLAIFMLVFSLVPHKTQQQSQQKNATNTNQHSIANNSTNDTHLEKVSRSDDAESSSSRYVTHHHYTTNNNKNITVLHEVHDGRAPLVLNTHEVLPNKPLKKKPYTLLDKPTVYTADFEKPRPLKDYELHPVTFDFNLSDLEDLEHETVKKGDLSAEEKHLLRSAAAAAAAENTEDTTDSYTVGGGFSYNDHLPFPGIRAQDVVAGFGSAGGGAHLSTSPEVSIFTTHHADGSGSGTTTTQPTAMTTPNVVGTVSPPHHVFNNKGQKHQQKTLKKGRELLKQQEDGGGETLKTASNTFNSISRYFGVDPPGAPTNATSTSLQGANFFQIITNLYDHFYWQASDIRTKVTTACGLEMQAYLTGLHGNFNWAQRAYDASGRYRGQLFFGNDKWLGQKNFCYELNRQLDPAERKHFEFEFYAALVSLRLSLPEPLNTNLQLGECLPRSCNAHDVHAILTLDPHAQMLLTINAAVAAHTQHNRTSNNNNNNNNQSNANRANQTVIQVLHVRSVPGPFSYWRELKFQIFLSLLFTLILLVTAATWYQSKLNKEQLAAARIPAISAKIDAVMASAVVGGATVEGYSNKASSLRSVKSAAGGVTNAAFEIYQMSTLNENNNNNNNKHDNIEPDVNGNKTTTVGVAAVVNNGNNANGGTRHSISGAATSKGSGGTTRRVHHAELPVADVEKAGTSAAATCAYEATTTKKQLGLHEQFLLCFAFQTNAGTILNMTENKEPLTSCVHGLRVFSVMWTILVHTYLQMFTIGENRGQRKLVERSFWYQFVGNATFSVDTFFFISGFLVTLLYLKQEKKYPAEPKEFLRRSVKDTGVILLYRYIRLTPAYLFVIFFNDLALRQTFDNSVFQPNVPADTCSRFWWRNILYINNFYPLSEICMIWSWYMANDMQFFVMASLLLVLSTRYFKTAALILCSFLLSSWGVTGVISLHYRYTHKVAHPFESFDFLYDKPWQRVGTYIMGMLVGYVIYKVKKPPPISTRTNYLLWLGSWSLLVLIIFGVWYGELGRLTTAFYVSVGHTAFGVGLIWFVLSCCWGISPTANRILSYRGLWPLSRLTYCTYLIHPVIMLITSYRMTGIVHLNNLFVMVIFLGNAVASFFVAFFISILFEAPVIRILKIFFR